MIMYPWVYILIFICGAAFGWAFSLIVAGGMCSDRLRGVAKEIRGYALIAGSAHNRACLMSEQTLLNFAEAIEDECRPDPPQSH